MESQAKGEPKSEEEPEVLMARKVWSPVECKTEVRGNGESDSLRIKGAADFHTSEVLVIGSEVPIHVNFQKD